MISDRSPEPEGTTVGDPRSRSDCATCPSQPRHLMKLPLPERWQRLRIDAERAKNHYLQDDEWTTLLGADLLPDD